MVSFVRHCRYSRIHIVGADSPSQLKKHRLKKGSRLKLLRRTLRERKLLANLVLELRVPEFDAAPVINGKPNPQWEEYRDLVASVVMVCPNLERLIGFDRSFHHEFDRLTYALSTRRKLKEHKWILGEPVLDTSGRSSPDTAARSGSPTKSRRSLSPQQVFEFLDYHVCWTNLETLALHSWNSASALEHGIFLRIFNRLPSLRHLSISCFDADAFTDRTLQFLPPLQSLRLECLAGVTDAGIGQYISRPEARGLQSLTIIEQNIRSLLVLSKMFASLPKLERFSIVQSSCLPVLPSEGMVLQPVLASASLKHLHWDITGPKSSNALSRLDSPPFAFPHKPSDTPNYHLAQSILCSGFPRLTHLRAPSDIEPPGILQSVCRPIAHGQALLPSDRNSLPKSSHGSVSIRPMALPAGNNLTSARIRAQTFIDMAAKDTETGMKMVVTDHSDSYVPDNVLEDDSSDTDSEIFGDGPAPTMAGAGQQTPKNTDGPRTLFEFRMPPVMGRVQASTNPAQDVTIPRFVLRPDIPGSDADGGIIRWKNILTTSHAFSLNRRESGALGGDEPPLSPLSPATPTASRFAGWSAFGTRSSSSSSSSSSSTATSHSSSASTSTSLSSPTSMPRTTTQTPFSFSQVPPWGRDTCNGHWNHAHANGRDWWMHVERERPLSMDIIETKHLF